MTLLSSSSLRLQLAYPIPGSLLPHDNSPIRQWSRNAVHRKRSSCSSYGFHLSLRKHVPAERSVVNPTRVDNSTSWTADHSVHATLGRFEHCMVGRRCSVNTHLFSNGLEISSCFGSVGRVARLPSRSTWQSSLLGAANSSRSTSSVGASPSFGSVLGNFPQAQISGRMNKLTMSKAVAKDKSNSGPTMEVSAPSEHTQEDFRSHVPDSIPLLSLAEVATRLEEYSRPKGKPYGAMYSSVVGGITLDPAAMVVPLDDHMVHRGHAVFDTATIFDGHLYELDAHLDRLLRSASKAKLTPPFQRSVLRDILVQTVAASGCKEGTLRYWLSAGPGGFGLSPAECEMGSFYAVVITERHAGPVDGVKVITSSIPIKPPQFATMKSTNYLPNAQVLMEAQEKGAFQGIWLDQEGFVAEASNMNVFFVSKGELLLPSFANILSGCTSKRLLILAQELVAKQGSSDGILKGIKEAKIAVEEGKAADEMMLVVSSYLVVPVIEWDGQPIGKGTVGPVTKALLSLLQQDVLEGPPEVREPVPYRQ